MKLHELLAAESGVTKVYDELLGESEKVFAKPAHFTKIVTDKHYFDATEASKLDTSEVTDMVTTVDERLSYFFGRPFTNCIDTILQKDATNANAVADLVVSGQTLAYKVPAITLLAWEKRFEGLRKLLLAIPTHQPGVEWEDDSDTGYKVSKGVKTFTTKKTMKPVVLHAESVHHPAQVEKVFEDVPIAEITKTTYSGMWTSLQKADALARLDALHIAIKQARQRANRTDVVKHKVGESLARFILKGPAADKLQSATDEVEASGSIG